MPLTFTDDSDDPLFLEQIDQIISAIAARHSPQQLRIFRIENWFDRKWLQFGGKILGAVAVWKGEHVIPPFVRNRLTARSLFEHDESTQTYRYAGDGPEIHHDGPSSDNLTRRAKHFAPNAALFWFSSNSAKNARGSLMAYLPFPNKIYWGFYIGFQRDKSWKSSELVNINRKELTLFQTATPLPISLPTSAHQCT
ncbi:MAG: hypothetical protein ACTHN5_15345 [Phycisphaerae bacterium]